MATTPKLVGPTDPGLAKSFETQTPSVARTSPPTVSASGAATSKGGTVSRGIAPKVTGDTTTYTQATQASSGTELFIVSSNNNDSSDIVTVYNTQKDISVSAINQTFNNYKVTNNNSYGNSNVADFLTSYDGDLSAGNLNVIGATNLGDVSNVHIGGGTNGQVLSTNGAGSLIWSNVSSGPSLGNITINGDEIASTNDIVNILGNDYAQLQSNDTYMWVEDGEADIEVNGNTWTFNNQGYMTIPNEGSFGALNSSVLSFSSQNNKPIFIEVIDTGSSTAQQWIFDNTGNLTLPNNSLLGDVYEDGGVSLQAPANSYASINSNNKQQFVETDDIFVYVGTAYGTGQDKQWKFDADGNITLPDNTSSINYANGTPYGSVAPTEPTADGTFCTLPDFLEFVGGTSLRTGQTNEGVFFDGNAGSDNISYPVRSNFSINGTTKVTVTVDMVVNDECSDFGLCVFEDGVQPEWSWNSNPTRIAAQYDCTTPEINTLEDSTSASWDIPNAGTYRVRFTYDPINAPNVTLETLDTSNTVLNTITINGTLNTSNDYYIGFAADQDDTRLRTYIQNLNISIDGGDEYDNSLQLAGNSAGVSIVPNDVTYTNGSLYGYTNPGFAVIITGDDDAAYSIPVDFPIEFLGESYGSGNVWLVSNSYLTFGPNGADYTDYHPVGPVAIPAPAIYLGSTDLSNQKYYYGYANGTDVFVIGFEGSIRTSGQEGYPAIQWELQVDSATPDQIKIVVNGPANNGGALNFPAGVWGVSDGAEWVDQFQPLPWYSNNNNSTYNSIVIAPVTPVTATTIAFTGPGVTYSENGGTTFINIDPFDEAISVGYDDDNDAASISSTYYELTLTTARDGESLNITPLGDVNINAGNSSDNQPGDGYQVYISGGNAHDNPNNPGQNNDGGYVNINGGSAVGNGTPGAIRIDSNGKQWLFNGQGQTLFPVLNTQRGDNPSGTISGYTLNGSDGSQEFIITTPDGTSNINSSQRLVINPGQGIADGEGGDIYLWAGRGGPTNGSGGDIKIRGGQGMADGTGGYIRIEAGDSQANGYPGYIDITGGEGGNSEGGYVHLTGGQGATAGGPAVITGGYGSNVGGDANIVGGYGGTNQGGNINITGGGSALGLPGYGNVKINSGASQWEFDNTGNLTLPSNTFAVNYANGDPVQLGGANTGNVTFNDVNIIGDGNLYLQPNPSNTDAYLDIYLTGGPDIHIAGNGENLILGRDNGANVSVQVTGNVAIQANAYISGTPHYWTFDYNGNLTLPDNTVLQNGGGIEFPSTEGEWDLHSSDEKIYIGALPSSMAYIDTYDANISVRIRTLGNPEEGPGYDWIFDPTGNLTLPSNTFAVNYANGQRVQLGGGNTNQISNGNSNVSIPTSNDNVYITTNSGSSKQWIFDTAGNLRTPGNVDIYGAINFPQQVSSLNWSTYNIELSQYGRINTNVDFFANANTIGAQYLKGDGSNVSNVSVTKIANGTSNVNIPTSNGNVVITANGSANWTFDTTGNLQTAGDIVGPANANFTIYANAGVHDFVFGDDGTFYAPDDVVLGGNSIYIGPGANTLTGTEHAVLIASSNHFAYIQGVINNVSDNGSADWVAQGHLGNDTGGWADMGFTSDGFGDANYTITGQGDGYVFAQSYASGQAPGGRGGNLVLATGENGTVNDIIFGTGGFLTSNIFGRISDANNALELSRAGATITLPHDTGEPILSINGGTEPGITSTDASLAGPANIAIVSNYTKFSGYTGAEVQIYSDDGSIAGDANLVLIANNSNTGNTSSWTFDTTGNLSLPGGGSIYSQSSTPSGNPGNTIILQPAGLGVTTNQQLLVYPTAGDGDHIHMTSGNLYQTELFLGNDNLYVKLANTGNVVINTNDDNGNFAMWIFGSDSSLTLPTISLSESTDEQTTIQSQRKIIPPFRYSAVISGTTPTVVYTASSNNITSMKITMQIQHTGLGMELFDVYATYTGSNTFYTVSNRVSPPTIANSTIVVGLTGSNEMQITVTINSGAANSWVTYDSTEFGIAVD